jgi:hypothetical protein
MTIRKFALEDGKLEEKGEVSFSGRGVEDMGFWVNTFVSKSKAYLSDAVRGYIIWNPDTMEISGTLEFPELTPPEDLQAFASYVDRSVVQRDGKLYLPIYYTDDTFFQYGEASTLLVIDTAKDEVVEQLTIPCPGIDYATANDDGDLYFSSWIFAPGGAALLDQPATCVAKLAAGASEVSKAFDIKDITDGREGGAFRYTGNGRALLSVLHPDHAPKETTDAQDITYGANWHFWSYDFKTEKATEVEDIDWNSGAAYSAEVDGDKAYMLVPTDGYAKTIVYDASGSKPVKQFETKGWSMRLFDLPGVR